MRKGSALIFAGLAVIVSALIIPLAIDSANLIISVTAAILGVVLIWIGRFERGSVVIERVVLLALLSALSSVGRILFSGIPGVQPSSFLIIVTGMSYGPEMGLMTGVITAIASNLVLGQGPWTPWQMFLWGIMGYVAGVCRTVFIKYRPLRVIYSFVWGYIFGWGMNLWFMVGYSQQMSVHAFIAAGLTSFYMDTAHAVSNVLLLLFAGNPLIRIFHRVALKYGLDAPAKGGSDVRED